MLSKIVYIIWFPHYETSGNTVLHIYFLIRNLAN